MFFFAYIDPADVQKALRRISTESSWIEIGAVLAEFEQYGERDTRAVPWAQHVLQRLDAIGRPVAAQQLRKIRRCYSFLKERAKVDLSSYSSCPLSGIEVVAKIFAIDQDQGLSQLEALRGGLPYTDILQTYEQMKISAVPIPPQAVTTEPRRLGHVGERQKILEREVMLWVEDDPAAFFGIDPKRLFSVPKMPKGEYQKADFAFRFATGDESVATKHAGFAIKQMGMAASATGV